VNGDPGAGLHVDRSEGLTVELVDPCRHVLHAIGEDATDGFVAADADSTD
jgi:hypothetical protein